MEDKKVLSFIDDANDTMEGFESINANTITIPFIKLLQKQSPEVDEDGPEHVPGAKAGTFLHSSNRQVMGNYLHIIVLKFERLYLEWTPDRGGLVDVHSVEHAQSVAVDTTFGNWRTASGNSLAENYVYTLLVEGHETEGPMILSLTSSNIKKAKELNRMMMSHIMKDGNRARPYYLVIKLTTERRENDKGSWYGVNFDFDHYINEQQYSVIKPERKAISNQPTNVFQIENKAAKPETQQISAPY